MSASRTDFQVRAGNTGNLRLRHPSMKHRRACPAATRRSLRRLCHLQFDGRERVAAFAAAIRLQRSEDRFGKRRRRERAVEPGRARAKAWELLRCEEAVSRL